VRKARRYNQSEIEKDTFSGAQSVSTGIMSNIREEPEGTIVDIEEEESDPEDTDNDSSDASGATAVGPFPKADGAGQATGRGVMRSAAIDKMD
jgi:hypothetical protein